MPGAEPSAPGGRRRLRRGTSEVDARWRHLPRRSARQCIVHRHFPERISPGQPLGGRGVVLADRIGAAADRDRAEASLHVASVRTPADRGRRMRQEAAANRSQWHTHSLPPSLENATRPLRRTIRSWLGSVHRMPKARYVAVGRGARLGGAQRLSGVRPWPVLPPPVASAPGTGVRKGVRMFRTTCRCDSSCRRRLCATRCGAVTGVAVIPASPG